VKSFLWVRNMAVKIKVQNLPKDLRRDGLEEKLAEFCRKNDIVFMAIFGSYARGDQTSKSDVDVVVEFDEKSAKTLLDLVRIEEELGNIFGRKVDLGVLSSINPYVLEHVKREMKIIYEKR